MLFNCLYFDLNQPTIVASMFANLFINSSL